MHGAYYATSHFFAFFESEAITLNLHRLVKIGYHLYKIFVKDAHTIFFPFVGPLNKYHYLATVAEYPRAQKPPSHPPVHTSPKTLMLYIVANGY